jgi:hypothetical protein
LLESKNDESRFGLTRAPFCLRRGIGARPKSSPVVTPHRAEIFYSRFGSDSMCMSSEILWQLLGALILFPAFILALCITSIIVGKRLFKKRIEAHSLSISIQADSVSD